MPVYRVDGLGNMGHGCANALARFIFGANVILFFQLQKMYLSISLRHVQNNRYSVAIAVVVSGDNGKFGEPLAVKYFFPVNKNQ